MELEKNWFILRPHLIRMAVCGLELEQRDGRLPFENLLARWRLMKVLADKGSTPSRAVLENVRGAFAFYSGKDLAAIGAALVHAHQQLPARRLANLTC